ncbi:MAG: ribose 5-phosphate isomerase B [Flavobacteriaceae bacterium]|nr:ribose 5-phosphate isomerase B [Flavobacteriaceae bacterium]
MKIAIGADHAGFELKEKIKGLLTEKKIEFEDFGTFSTDSVDYPDFAHPTAKAVLKGDAELGILLCGSGNGVAMTANKYAGIRAAMAWTPELAELGRQHNNANILVLPARFISDEEGLKITEAFLQADFEGGRHQRRVDKISC